MALNHQTISCATQACYAVITLHPDDEARLRRTGETFYCPAGHPNILWVGKSKLEKRVDGLERALNRVQEMRRETLELAELLASRLLSGAAVELVPWALRRMWQQPRR